MTSDYHRLRQELDRVGSRIRTFRWLTRWTAANVFWAVFCLLAAFPGAWLAAAYTPLSPSAVTLTALGVVTLGLVSTHVWIARTTAPDPNTVGQAIETAFPELRTCLLAAVQQQPDLPDGRFGYLQQGVIRQAVQHSRTHEWISVVSARRMTLAFLCNLATGVVLFVSVVFLFFARPDSPKSIAVKAGKPAPAVANFTVTVEPGDTEIEKGSSLLVLARIEGEPPPEAVMVVEPAAAEVSRVPLARSLEDPVFGGRIPAVKDALSYRVELGGQVTPTYTVTVFEYPRIERADAKLVFPQYTEQPERVVQDVRTVTVVEGTELTLTCLLNKPVRSAVFTGDKQPPVPLAAVTGDKPSYEAVIPCTASRRMTLELVDDAGRKNQDAFTFTIHVLPNNPPTLKLVSPAKDVEVSPLEELLVKATAWDDFGLVRYGVTYSLAGRPPVEAVLGEKGAPKSKLDLANLIRLEDLKAEPDQLLSYFVWAEDHDTNGAIRRTSGDMYFAEVRHFEEIFRQGEQPAGGQNPQQMQQGQSPNAQQAQQLAQLQKDIINATWNLLRRETGAALSEAFRKDVDQIAESQAAAEEQAKALAEKLQDGESQEHAAAVLRAMADAREHLKAAGKPMREPLQPALAAEQAAYQGLLKLRAREHRVVRQQQQQQGSSQQTASARSQQQRQQMQQLDLKQDENRYETQRMAQAPQESAESREDRQVLNRLKELARRQQDVNERLKELQSALEEAKTEEKKEELRRQLQRLQEEQRQILQDTDELKSRMEESQNQERMAESREQLEQTREQVRRSSEALEQQQITQAAAAGTRAGQEFEDLRNEFRRRASNRFNEEMRQMREQARDLDQKQKELGQELARAGQPDPSKQKSLRSEDPSEKVAKELEKQRTQLSNLKEQMKQVIEEAEQSEPLLTERLYDATRNAQQQRVEEALRATEQSLQRGLLDDAKQQEQAASRGVGELRKGIEKAAEAVLGDETEALRRARDELQRLSRDLNDEIARNSPENRPRNADEQVRGEGRGEREEEGERRGRPQPGEARGERRQPRDNQPRERPGQPGGQGQNPMNDDQQPVERPMGDTPQQPGQTGPQPNRPGPRQPGQQQGSGQGRSGENRPQEGEPQSTDEPGEPRAGQQGRGQGPPQDAPQNSRTPNPESRNPPRGQSLSGPTGGAEDVNRGIDPLTGENFREWSDRLRDVEEMVDDPELRAEAARIRERARSIRAESKRHSEKPRWDLVRVEIGEPLNELRDRVAEALLRKTSQKAIVPLDRDPVPLKYTEATRRYYERLGTGK